MAREREQEEPVAPESTEDAAAATGSNVGGRLGRPLTLAATFAAGAAAALAAKSFLESRRKGGVHTPAPGADMAQDEDLATALRRAALDVAIAATNEAAERLSVEDQSEAQGREGALQRS
jgi:hypothetical protein